MKTLLLVRHAKSSWDDASLSDFERPLNERGKRDAPEMAKRILSRKISIDLFVSSAAKRAKKTAKIFMNEFNKDESKLVLIKELYEAQVDNFYSTIINLDNKNNTVALFGHNPGITDFINSLSLTQIFEMPTCGVYAISIQTKEWGSFKNAKKDFLFFDFQKNEE